MKEYKWCAIDAEGDVGRMGLRGVAFYSDNVQRYITDHAEIKAVLLYHAEWNYTFLAHNAQYDLPVIFWQLDIPMKAVYYNGRFNRGEWRYDKRKALAQLWDTLSLSGGLSLAKLGAALGLPKYETPQRLRGLDPDRFTWLCELHDRGECEECYAVRDAEIVYRFATDLARTLSGWGVAPHRRISGLAMSVWRQLDTPDPIHISNPKIRRLARKAYHGGRVETFKLGHISPLYTADVCSMYPSVMVTAPYPDPRDLVHLTNPALAAVPLEREGVAEADLSVPPMYCPPLPYVYKGTLHYPVGRVRGYWTLAELRYAVSLGCRINRVYQCSFSTRNVYPFTNFINTLWTMREEYERTGDPRSLFAKLLMNNLYGRIGMGEELERKDIYPAAPNTRLSKQPKTSWYTDDGKLYLTYEREQPTNNNWSNPMWAAQTTAYARLRLHAYLLQQGRSVVYCDTDSVFSTQPIVGLGEGLGSLRDEVLYGESIIAAPKLYALRDATGTWHAKAKGVPKAVALRFLREGTATYEQPIKPSSQGIRKIPAGTWLEVTKTTQRTPARRHPLDPSALLTEWGWSDTAPAVIGPLP